MTARIPLLPFSIMDRYILRELLLPFIFGVVAFSSIGVAIGELFYLFRQVTDVNLPLAIVAQVLILKLPFFVGLAFPMSILLSCLMVYGQLSGDSEIIALRSCGVSIYRLIAPALLLSLVVTGITFVFNEAIVPSANRQASQILEQALNKREPSFREKNILYQEYANEKQPDGTREKVLSRLFYAKQFDGQQMKGLTILDFSQKGITQILVAESAQWNGADKIWDFFGGMIYAIAPDGSYRNILRFDQQQFRLPRTPLDIAKTKLDPAEMNIAETVKYRDLMEQTGNQKRVRKLQMQIDQKMALPFACFVFGLTGSALGTRPQRTGRAAGFGLSLLIIVSYYLLISVGEALYGQEIFSSVMAAWMPTSVCFVAGVLLLLRRQ